MKARNIAIAAVSAALSIVFMLISRYVPVIRTTPLILACFAMQLAFLSAGWLAGVLSMIASLGICFAFSGFTSTFLLTAFLFYPYCLIAYFIRNYEYRGTGIAIRLAASGAIANIGLCILYFLTDFLFFDLSALCDLIGGYAVLALVVTVIFWIFDFIFLMGTKYLSKLILRGRK